MLKEKKAEDGQLFNIQKIEHKLTLKWRGAVAENDRGEQRK